MAGNIKLNWICTSPTTIFSRVLPTLYKTLKQRIMVLAVIFLFFIRKKEDYTLYFQSWSTFKNVPKNINNWVIDYHEKKKKTKLLTNLYKKCFLFRITQSILFLLNLKNNINFLFYWTRWLDWTRRCMYGSLCTLTGGGVLCLFPIIDLCDHSL